MSRGRRVTTPPAQASLEILTVDFDYNLEGCSSDAITMRRNFRTPLPKLSWERDRDLSAEPSYAAYSIASTLGNTIKIKAVFRATDPRLRVRGFHVRAIDPDGGEINVLGGVSASDLIDYFDDDFLTMPTELSLDNVRLAGRGVGKHRVVWRWQYMLPGTREWVDFDSTEHTVYSLLGEPRAPWRQPPSGNLRYSPRNDSQLPWIEVLDVVCDWAKGAKNFVEAASRITERLYALGKTPVTYQGRSAYIRYNVVGDYADQNEVFYCTNFLDLLAGKPTRAPHLNCLDCASVVMTFANILGCDLSAVRFGDPHESFRLNPLLPMGFDTPDSPEAIDSFPFHEVAWRGDWQGDAAANGLVFDACAKLDETPKEDQPNWVLPSGVPFGEPTEEPAYGPGYVHRLVARGDRTKCAPRQAFRRAVDAPQRPLPPTPLTSTAEGSSNAVRPDLERLKKNQPDARTRRRQQI